MKNSLLAILFFSLGAGAMYLYLPSGKTNKQLITIDSEKSMPARDMVSQYQKFYKTFDSFQHWDSELKKEYLEQNQLSEEFIKVTEQYFSDSIKTGKSIKVEEIK